MTALLQGDTFLHTMNSPYMKDTSEHINRIFGREQEVIELAQSSKATALDLPAAISMRMCNQEMNMQQCISKEELEKMLQWLSLPLCCEPHESISKSRLEGTGQWLIEHERFKHWQTSSSPSAFLLRGVAGSGKTNICSMLVDLFLTNARDQPSIAPFAYFYCPSLGAERPPLSLDKVMRAILAQLAIDKNDNKKVRNFLWTEYQRRSVFARVNDSALSKLTTQESGSLIL